MSVIELPVQIRLVDLLHAIERLSPTEFGLVASRVADIQRTQQLKPSRRQSAPNYWNSLQPQNNWTQNGPRQYSF